MRVVLKLSAALAIVCLSACSTPAPSACTNCSGQCVDLNADSQNCGACGTACAAGSVCRAGACAVSCQAGLTTCGDTCVDTRVDSAHCGACGTVCSAGTVCQAGKCAAVCPATETLCGSTCVTLASDLANCGACGNACPTGAVCTAGQCQVQCQPSQLSCDGGACINAQTDNVNCGACGVTCAPGEVCSNGACGTSCAASLTTCTADGGVRSCADTKTDNVNCGACGVTCAQGQSCTAGQCRTTCGGAQTLCGDADAGVTTYCATLTQDVANCGGCGIACGAGQSCSMGACVTTCGPTERRCGADAGIGGFCTNTQTDATNCGGCGIACASGQVCAAGSCQSYCGAGNTLCTVNGTPVCTNLANDDANCGMCGATCAGGCRGGFCPTSVTTTVTASANLSTTNMGARSCAQGGEMVRYSVTALTRTTATTSVAPAAGCLSAGDELLLINLQGTATANGNVGNYELLRVASVSGSTITFSAAKTKFYGDGASDDTNLGTTRTTQRVVVQRVPLFDTLRVTAWSDGGVPTLTADEWNGTSGGVFALRAASQVQLGGAIDMRAKGFTGAPATTTASTSGKQGESAAGLGAADDRNQLSAGGAGRGQNTGCVQANGAAGGGAGHALWGARGSQTCSGAGGAPVGSATMTRLFLGGGGASGGTSATLNDNPPGGAGGRGGGIVMLLTPVVEATRTIDVSGTDGQGDPPGTNCPVSTSTTSCWDYSGPGGGGAGGSLFVSGAVHGQQNVRFNGGIGGDGLTTFAGIGGKGSFGRVFPLPTTCADLHPAMGDGEGLFAFGGDSSKPYLATCVGVGTANPRMYLTLSNRGTSQNYALYDARAWSASNTIITTRFQKVRFAPLTRTVIPDDYTYTTSTGSGTGGPFGTTTVTQEAFGTAGDCSGGGSTGGSANIDLRGLPLAVSVANAWVLSGWAPGGTSTFSYDRQVVQITGGGACGANGPVTFPNGEIELTYLAPRATCADIKAAVPAATDGIYTVKPNAVLPPLPISCDMTFSGGGWMLLEDAATGGGTALFRETYPVLPGAGGYVPMSVARLFASAGSQLNVRTAGMAATRSVTSNANAKPIVNLRDGHMLNFAYVSNEAQFYTGTMLTSLTTSCGIAPIDWPNLYHACNNQNGLHWVPDASRWAPGNADEALQLWLR